ncbi:hypothetical protein JCGZ_10575 [Jatropha curcas]|uniref:DOG1 domain-containing protein n=1 Tax=Jatropha curcas TaxID=180498 RepID=A0A067KR96_JATCU|nr:hypothetical protein JCGZ_10575 [Jatropha curcas]
MSGATSFGRFYETWFDQLHHMVNQLRKTSKPPPNQDAAAHLSHFVDKLMNHYAEYYRVKSAAAERDVLSVFTAPWASSLERSLHWIAGWRPTTLFHLMYTESSILFESHIVDILRGLRTGDLGDLSPTQRVSELQCETVKEENALTDQLSEWQDGASELAGSTSGTDVDEKIGRLVSIVHRADDLRLRTVRMIVDMLTPYQAAEFLVAVADLQFGIHIRGRNQDRLRQN